MDVKNRSIDLYAERARKIFRCPIDDPKQLPARLSHGGGKIPGKTFNLSHAGMMIVFDKPNRPVAVGAQVDVSLHTPSGLARLAGVVRHCTRSVCGVEFIGSQSTTGFEPPLRLQQSIFAAQKSYLEKRRRNGR
jgi:hypothetical protein